MIPNETGTNMGGNTKLQLVLANDVVQFNPKTAAVNLGLIEDAEILEPYFTYETLRVSTPPNDDIFMNNITWLVPRERKELFGSIVPWLGKKVLAIVTDGNGVVKIYGSKACPLVLSFQPTAKTSVADYNGYQLSASGADVLPGRFLEGITYYEEVEPDEPDTPEPQLVLLQTISWGDYSQSDPEFTKSEDIFVYKITDQTVKFTDKQLGTLEISEGKLKLTLDGTKLNTGEIPDYEFIDSTSLFKVLFRLPFAVNAKQIKVNIDDFSVVFNVSPDPTNRLGGYRPYVNSEGYSYSKPAWENLPAGNHTFDISFPGWLGENAKATDLQFNMFFGSAPIYNENMTVTVEIGDIELWGFE